MKLKKVWTLWNHLEITLRVSNLNYEILKKQKKHEHVERNLDSHKTHFTVISKVNLNNECVFVHSAAQRSILYLVIIRITWSSHYKWNKSLRMLKTRNDSHWWTIIDLRSLISCGSFEVFLSFDECRIKTKRTCFWICH